MTASPEKQEAPDVPAQVFENFLLALTDAAVPEEVINRLKTTLLHDKSFTERALRDAVLGEDQQV